MKSIDPALEAAQKTAAGAPIVTAALSDNGRLHLESFAEDGPAAGGDAVYTGAEIVQCRVGNGSNAHIYVRRITDPTNAAEWTAAWTDIDSGPGDTLCIGIFWTGTYVVVCWSDTSVNIYYKRSADGGQTWGAKTLAYTTPDRPAHLNAISGGADHSGLFWARYAGVIPCISFGAYNEIADTWAAADVHDVGTTASDPLTVLAAAWDEANSQWLYAFAAVGYAEWGIPVVLGTRSTSDVWTEQVQYIASATSSYGIQYMSYSQGTIGGRWYLKFIVVKEYFDVFHFVATSYDGLHFSDPWAVNLTSSVGIPGRILAVDDYTYLILPERVWRSTPHTFWSDAQATYYQLDLNGPVGLLTLNLNNSAGDLTEPKKYALLTLTRGLTVNGTAYPVSAGNFYLTHYKYSDLDNIIELTAIDACGLLARTVATFGYRFDSCTLQELVILICGLAGLPPPTFDAAAFWSDTIDVFFLNLGRNCLDALVSVAVRGCFDIVVQQDGSLYCFAITASPSALYTYGNDGASHVHWPGKFGKADTPNYVAVFGQFDENNFIDRAADRADYDAQRDAGRRLSNPFNERRIVDVADAEELAAARIILAKELAKTGAFDAPVNFALEPGDVIAFSQNWEADNGPWRVTGFTETYNGPAEKKFFQAISLRGTA